MIKKILLTTAVILVSLTGLGYLFRDSLMLTLIASQLKPAQAFDPAQAPQAPDYHKPEAWAALPETEDPADAYPPGIDHSATPGEVKVFFIHPTTYMARDNWNQPLTDADANWIVEQRVLRHQASVFNSCCEIYAPRYRQATFYAFLDDGDSGKQALDLAYQDVARAFAVFISELKPGAPFILAGHSQGSAHGARLLREEIAGRPLAERLVAAYLIGFSISEDQLGGVPVCASATQTGCAIGWNTVDGDSAGLFPGQSLICVNPLTWSVDGSYAEPSRNLGGIGYPSWGPGETESDVTTMRVEPGVADARCVADKLEVVELLSQSFPSRMPGNSMHIYDYSLFHMNIRENAMARVLAYLSGNRISIAETGG